MRTPAVALLLAALPAAAASQIVKEPLSRPKMVAIPVGAPPTALSIGSTPSSITIRWGCPAGASGYDVYATPNGGGQMKVNPAPISGQCVQDLQVAVKPMPGFPAPSTSPTYSQRFTHAGLTPGSSYTYVVVALYPNGASGASDPMPAQVSLHPVPPSFVAAPSGRSAQLGWGAVPGVTGYQVHRMLAGQPAFQMLVTTPASATSWTDPMVLPPGQHRYFVQALSGLPAAAATVTIPPWPAPTHVSVTDLGSNLIVNWDLVPWFTGGYLVFRQRQGEAGFSQVTPSPVTPLPAPFVSSGLSYQDPGAVMAQRTSYYVKAVDGDASTVVSVVAGGFTTLQLTGFCGSGTMDFRWGGTGLGASVKVVRGGTPAGPFYPTTEYPGNTGDFIRIVGNPVGVMQYYKLQAAYPTGVAESVVVPITIPVDAKGFELFPTKFVTPANGVTLEWQCAK